MRDRRLKLSDVKAGDRLVADGGFTCLKAGAEAFVCADRRGDLYVQCGCGRHFLDGQADEAGFLVGLKRPARETADA